MPPKDAPEKSLMSSSKSEVAAAAAEAELADVENKWGEDKRTVMSLEWEKGGLAIHLFIYADAEFLRLPPLFDQLSSCRVKVLND